MIFDEFHYLRLAGVLLEKAEAFDKGDLDNAEGDSAPIRTEVLRDFLEQRLGVEITPKAAIAVNSGTRNPEEVDANELGQTLKVLLAEALRAGR